MPGAWRTGMGFRMHCFVPEPLGWKTPVTPLPLLLTGKWVGSVAQMVECLPGVPSSGVVAPNCCYTRRIRYSRSSWLYRSLRPARATWETLSLKNKIPKKTPGSPPCSRHTELEVGLGVRNLNTQGISVHEGIDFVGSWQINVTSGLSFVSCAHCSSASSPSSETQYPHNCCFRTPQGESHLPR